MNKVQAIQAATEAYNIDAEKFYNIGASSSEIKFQGYYKPSLVTELSVAGIKFDIQKGTGYVVSQSVYLDGHPVPIKFVLT